MLDGSVDEFFEFGEGDDFIELAGDFGFAHAEDGAGEKSVFAAGKLGMEAGTDFEEGADAAVNLRPAGSGAGDAGKDFEKSGFAGAVATDEAEDFAFADFEGDVFQGPEGFVLGTAEKLRMASEGRLPRNGGDRLLLASLGDTLCQDLRHV